MKLNFAFIKLKLIKINFVIIIINKIIKKMNKEQVIEIVTSMGFRLDYDQWDNQKWLRFQLKEELDEKDLRWIWFNDESLVWNLSRGAQIIFKAGQKAKIQQLNNFIEM